MKNNASDIKDKEKKAQELNDKYDYEVDSDADLLQSDEFIALLLKSQREKTELMKKNRDAK